MGKFGKGMVPLSSQTTAEKRAYLDARADRLGWKRSKLLTLVLDYWLACGAPALSELDSPIPLPRVVISDLPTHWAVSEDKKGPEVVHSRLRH